MIHRLQILGKPVSKKNAWKRAKHGGVYVPQEIKAWQDAARFQIRSQWEKPPIISVDVNVACAVHLVAGQRIDLDNAIVTICDELQECDVLYNDKQICGFDGSLLVRNSTTPGFFITITQINVFTGADCCSQPAVWLDENGEKFCAGCLRRELAEFKE